jgi:hypothetical protein
VRATQMKIGAGLIVTYGHSSALPAPGANVGVAR